MSRRVPLHALALLAAVGLAEARPAAADTVIYSTVGTGFLQSEGWLTHGFDAEAGEELQISVAMPFTIRGARIATIRTIELGFSFDPTGEDFVQVDIFNASNGRPGLSAGVFSFDLPFDSTPSRLLTIDTNIALRPGLYFLGLRTTGDIVGHWWQTSAPFFGGWESINDGPWFQRPDAAQGVFRLSGDVAPIPEPGSLVLLTTGSFGLFRAIRRRRAELCAN